MMDRIARRVGDDELYRTMMDAQHADPQETAADAITAGVPFGMPGSTDILRIAWVERPVLPAAGHTRGEQEGRSNLLTPVMADAGARRRMSHAPVPQ